MMAKNKYHHRYGKKNAPKPKPTLKTVGLVIYGDCKVYEILQAIKFEVKK